MSPDSSQLSLVIFILFFTILLSPFKSIKNATVFFSFPQISTSAQAGYTIVTVSPHVEIPMGLTVVPVIIPPQEMEKHARILWRRVSIWNTSQAYLEAYFKSSWEQSFFDELGN